MSVHVGIGYDIHRLKKGKGVRLGGIFIPCQWRLVGHSDADVLIHAVCDALLGAAGLGDIGAYFPDSDKKFQNRESSWFLRETVKKIQKKGFKVLQMDSVIIAEKPKLLEYRVRTQKNLARLLQIPIEQVNIKAKTNEGLDSIGGRKAIAAWAVSLVEKVKAK